MAASIVEFGNQDLLRRMITMKLVFLPDCDIKEFFILFLILRYYWIT